jgi:hypothetical protein
MTIASRGGRSTHLAGSAACGSVPVIHSWSLKMAGAVAFNNRSTMTLTWVAFWLLVVGGLDWLMVGLFRFDLVAAVLGVDTVASRIVYGLVGISAVYCAVTIPALRGSSRLV